MCILCVIQKCSRRVAIMLPWLIIPLVGLWALSQLLPPGFRFEITSPRLACLMVLLVTLFWYEVLMPKLSSWRIRRSAWLRERKRVQAIELQKLRKMAVRRCRNCLTAYRDQNPGGGGKFMCSYCGHISKRPVLDIPGSADLDAKKSGFVGDLVGKSGKIWNEKVWSEHGWICSNDWLDNGNWVPGSFTENSIWVKNGGKLYSGKDLCFADKSYSVVVVFFVKVLFSFFFSVRWLWRKFFKVSSSEDGSSDAEHMGMSKKGGNGVNMYESKVEKARRKAEEKRHARLERELLEEEERKQREDVAKLVEERRRLRDEEMEAEKLQVRGSANGKEKDSKREAEKKRQERRKDKDKGSSKSSSDCEEIDRRAGKEMDRKRELDKRSEIERRDQQKAATTQISESRHGIKVSTANVTKGTGTRYLERVRGSLISSSKALNGTSFFGKGTRMNQTSATNISKANKLNGFVDHAQGSANQRDMSSSTHAPVIVNSNGDNNAIGASSHRPGGSEMQSQTVKKSWQQLFTRSPGMPNMSPQIEGQRPNFHRQSLQMHSFENQLGSNLALPSHVSLSPNGSKSSNSYSSLAAKPIFPVAGEPPYSLAQEESEIFEDPCYVPDPAALLGPVSESLDHFSYDLGTGFMRNSLPQNSMPLKHVITSMEVSKPSPIEPPMSRLHGIEVRLTNSFPCSPKTPERNSSPLNESNSGTWQMWGTSPLVQDGLGFVGGSSSWLSPIGQNSKNMTSKFVVDNQVPPGNHFQRGVQPGSCLTGWTFSPICAGLYENDPWLPNPISPPLSGVRECYSVPVSPPPDISQSELIYGSSSRSATRQPFEPSPVIRWPKKDSSVHGLEDGITDPTMGRPHIGGLFSTPDVQSVWSYN